MIIREISPAERKFMGNFDKPYEELLFRDNFMFVKTMEFYPDYCIVQRPANN